MGRSTLVALGLCATLGCDGAPSPREGSAKSGVASTLARPPAEPPSAPGAALRVRASHALGVPLHPEPGSPRVSGRLVDGASVTVEEQRDGGRWLRVVAADGARGWMTSRYVAGEGARVAAAAADDAGTSSAWTSPQACEAALAAGTGARRPGRARIATWNIRWFPDGGPGKRPSPKHETDLGWLGCAIAWLGADALALQEIKAYPRAKQKAAALLADLDRRTGGGWRIVLDDCPDEAAQHVGLLWASKRVTLESHRPIDALNPHGGGCAKGLRPGLAGRLRFPGGLDLTLVSLHLKSGRDERAHGLRRRSYAAIGPALRAIGAADGDVLLAGDFNSMGCDDCEPRLSAANELGAFERLIGGFQTPLRRVPSDASCTERAGAHGGLLDHFVAPRAMRELGAGTRADVSGYCDLGACERGGEPPSAHARLSDHCPVVLELDDRDLD